jgi:hypothetical protein
VPRRLRWSRERIRYYRPFRDYQPSWRDERAWRPPSQRQLWLAVASARRRAGDEEGRQRALRAAALSVSLRRRRMRRPEPDPYRYHKTHWKTWKGMEHGMMQACGTAAAVKLSEDPAEVTCGNCMRVKTWPGA